MQAHHTLVRTKGVLAAVIAPWLLWAKAADGGADAANMDPGGVVELSPSEVSRILQQSPLPNVPHDPSNAVETSEAAAYLGQFLFFDQRLSGNGELSCANCHRPNLNWTDGKQLSQGAHVG